MCLDAIVLEALQDGSVNIPEVLQPYMMGMKVLLVGLCELEKNSKVLSQGRLEAKKGSHIFHFFDWVWERTGTVGFIGDLDMNKCDDDDADADDDHDDAFQTSIFLSMYWDWNANDATQLAGAWTQGPLSHFHSDVQRYVMR